MLSGKRHESATATTPVPSSTLSNQHHAASLSLLLLSLPLLLLLLLLLPSPSTNALSLPQKKRAPPVLRSPRPDPRTIQSSGLNNASAAAALKGAQEQFSAGNNAAQLSPWKLMTARWKEEGEKKGGDGEGGES